MADKFVNSVLQNRVVLSIGVKGSGKSYLMLNFLRHCFKHKLYQRYVLVLPAFRFEQNDSYSFINEKDKNVFVFDEYHEIIASDILKFNAKRKVKTLFIIDDASAQDIWSLDDSLKHLITILRHTETTLWMLVHAASGILSPFLRMNTDILLLSKLTNRKLLENIWEEYMSLHQEYSGRDGYKAFLDQFIELHKKKYQVFYIDNRENIIDFNAGSFKF